MIHVLKTESEYYHAVKSGVKKFELRENDRDFKVGDFLHLHEYVGGRFIHNDLGLVLIVTYILEDCIRFGLIEGFCIMGIKNIHSS